MDELVSIVGGLQGISKFVLVDSKGQIKGHNMSNPGPLSHLAFSCGRRLSILGKKNFKYARFSRENGQDILIFPVGKGYLGVVKRRGIDNCELVSHVLATFQGAQG